MNGWNSAGKFVKVCIFFRIVIYLIGFEVSGIYIFLGLRALLLLGVCAEIEDCS